MTTDEIEDLAYQGLELPEGLTASETLLFLLFRNLYDFAKRTRMNREQGRREKLRILTQYERYNRAVELSRLSAALYARTELALSAYRKNPSIKTADQMLIAIDGALLRKKELDREQENQPAPPPGE